jgi:hypothetical protein
VIGRINLPLEKNSIKEFFLPHLNEYVEPIVNGSDAEGD